MEREQAIRELHSHIESLARLNVRHGLHGSEGFRRQKEEVQRLVREYGIDVRQELEPMTRLLYRRYFD